MTWSTKKCQWWLMTKHHCQYYMLESFCEEWERNLINGLSMVTTCQKCNSMRTRFVNTISKSRWSEQRSFVIIDIFFSLRSSGLIRCARKSRTRELLHNSFTPMIIFLKMSAQQSFLCVKWVLSQRDELNSTHREREKLRNNKCSRKKKRIIQM